MTRKNKSGQSAKPPVPLEKFLRHRRSRLWMTVIAGLVVLSGLILIDHNGYLLYEGTDYDRYHENTFLVTRIVDGDTLHIDAPDGGKKYTVVRLWGIDTPEIAKRDKGQIIRPAQAFGDRAKQFTDELCRGKRIKLLLEEHSQRGKFGRLLAHVELSNDKPLNELLLLAGLAKADNRFPHSRFDRYHQLQQEAKKAKIGLWQ